MLAPGTILQNRYLIIKHIGQGGMGTVYHAKDRRLHNSVALKETLFSHDRALGRAFEREAGLLANLRHPALPKVIDHFVEGEGQYLVMEFIPGEDLLKMLEGGERFQIADVLEWGDQLLDVLDYLHKHEIPVIHRDIKPQNLKLTARSQIILLDFGLAKGVQSQMTHTNKSLFGYTPNYAPLEQIRGMGTDARSDIYGLGATLYHLMTGQKPPDALIRATTVVGGQADPLVPANELNPDVPRHIADILQWSLNQTPDKRPQTASVMREALKEARRGMPEAATNRTIDQIPTLIRPAEPVEKAAFSLSSPTEIMAETKLIQDERHAAQVSPTVIDSAESERARNVPTSPAQVADKTQPFRPPLPTVLERDLRDAVLDDMGNLALRERYLKERSLEESVMDEKRARGCLIVHSLLGGILGALVGMIPGYLAANSALINSGAGLLILLLALLFSQWLSIATNRGLSAALGWMLGGAVGGVLWDQAGFYDSNIGGAIGGAVCGLIAGAGSARAFGRLGPLPFIAYLLSTKRAQDAYLVKYIESPNK